MYNLKFRNLNLISNYSRIIKKEVILIFYGLGLSSGDFQFLFRKLQIHKQILIIDLPGHSQHHYKPGENLLDFSKMVFQFLLFNNIKVVSVFCHSIGGIVPILLFKFFLKKKIKIKRLINYEGNLIKSDTSTLTKKTISYSKNEFINIKYNKLIEMCSSSDINYLFLWSKSLKKTSANAFYKLSQEAVKYSESGDLLKFYRIFFKNKIYLSGSLTKFNISEFIFGSVRYKFKNCGHFSHFENPYEFKKTFCKLINLKF